jgi:putative DNA primase/helicase
MSHIELSDYIDYQAYYYERVQGLEGGGGQLLGYCPFHSDKNQKSLSVNTTTGQWKCFAGCGQGNIWAFHEQHTGMDRDSSNADLRKLYGIPGKSTGGNSTKHKAPHKKAASKKAPATPKEAPIIPDKAWAAWGKLDDDWIEHLKTVRLWTRAAIEHFDIRRDTHYLSKNGEEAVRRQRRSDYICIPIFDSEGNIRNIRRYLPSGPREEALKKYEEEKKAGKSPRPVLKICSIKAGYGNDRMLPSPAEVAGSDDTIYFVEGEPDLICAYSLGINACTRTGKKHEWTDEEKEAFKGKNVILAFDADQAGERICDTTASILKDHAKAIFKLMWPDFMGKLPGDNWPKKGGQDFTDFFLRHGKTIDDFNKLLQVEINFGPVPKGVEAHTEDGKRILEREGQLFESGYMRPDDKVFLSKDENRIFVYPGAARLDFDKKESISDFSLEVLRSYISAEDGKALYMVRLSNERGIVRDSVEMQPKNWTSPAAFREWSAGVGHFNWRGSQDQLDQLRVNEARVADPRMIRQLNQIGWYEDEKAWIFSDHAVKDGEAVKADPKDGVLWFDQNGYVVMDIGAEGAEVSLLPRIRTDISQDRAKEVRQELADTMVQNIGGHQARLMLGFIGAVAYQRQIFEKFSFPILWLTGLPQCGKNTAATTLMSHFGLGAECAQNMTKITPAAFTRQLSYFSGIPVWGDEYRTIDPHCTQHESAIRSVYDRTISTKGRIGHGVITTSVRSTLIITGETGTHDSALMSRCAIVYIDKAKRKDHLLDKIFSLREEASAAFYWLLRERTTEKTNVFLKEVDDFARKLKKAGVHSRQANNYAVLAISYTHIYDPEMFGPDRDEFLDWVLKEAADSVCSQIETLPHHDFFDGIAVLQSQGILDRTDVAFDSRYATVKVWMKGVHEQWVKWRTGRQQSCHDLADVEKHIKAEPYFKERPRSALMFPGGTRKRCVILDYAKMPDELQAVFEPFDVNEVDQGSGTDDD